MLGAYSEEATLAFFDGKQELQADGLQTFQARRPPSANSLAACARRDYM